jgi:hypothetical protein
VRRTTPSTGNLRTHVTAIIVVPACLALGWWQVTRALSGNTLSWAYVFEWPIFAGYAVFMWWKLTHDREDSPDPASTDRASTDGDGTGRTPPNHGHQERSAVSSPGDEDDEELASYNRYLAALNASGKRKHW